VAGFDRTANELELWIKIEQDRSGIHDPSNFAYSMSATSMARRRDALMRSRQTLMLIIEDLKRQLGEAAVHA
jgi:flagellar protein FliJ